MKSDPNVSKMPSDEEITQAFERYIAAAGRVLHSWNDLHEKLGQLFHTVLGGNKPQVMAVWYSIPNDYNQRQMLRAAAVTKDKDEWPQQAGGTPLYKYLEEIEWLLKDIDKLAYQRNDAIHAPASLYVDATQERKAEMGPWYFYGHPRAKSLKGKKLLEEFSYYDSKAQTYAEYANAITNALTFPEKIGMPPRPLVPTRGQKNSRPSPPRQ